jgi:CDP-diacylglycerol--glycerol-3-phosphate 3-phosphatidyltransferase
VEKTKITLATKITIARMVILPFIVFFYLSGSFIDSWFLQQHGRLIGLALFLIAFLTDWLDGYIARKYNQISDLGKLLDPIADKLLTVVGISLIITDPEVVRFSFYHDYALMPLWFAVSLICFAMARDFIVSLTRQVAADKGIIIAAHWSGKIKTVVMLSGVALTMLFAYLSFLNFHLGSFNITNEVDFMGYICLFLLSACIVLNIYSAYDYVDRYRKEVKSKFAIGEIKTEGAKEKQDGNTNDESTTK